MSQKKNEGILFATEIRVVGSYTDRLLSCLSYYTQPFEDKTFPVFFFFVLSQ